jgi:hypothetical protein
MSLFIQTVPRLRLILLVDYFEVLNFDAKQNTHNCHNLVNKFASVNGIIIE